MLQKAFIPGFGDYLPFFLANPLKLGQVEWGPLVYSHFQVSPEMIDRVQVQSRTFIELSLSHYCVILAVCLGSLSCWNLNLWPSLRSWVLSNRFSVRISLYVAPFRYPSILSSLPVPAAEKPPHSMMLPSPCYTIGIGMVLGRLWTVPGFLQI